MRLTLDAIAVLDAIDRRGSFATAAEELHRVPSALTYTVQKLEQDLGVVLFDRSGHRARLTEAGRELLQEGRHLLRAAGELEQRVKRVATGWEAELRLAVSDLIPIDRLFPLLTAFYQRQSGTRLRLMTEVYGGCWDARVSGRADLALGAPGEGPAGGGYATRVMGDVSFVFVVAPDHPLAQAREPLKNSEIIQYRSVTAADSSRSLPPRTSGLLSGQDVLTVPDSHAKRMAHEQGLGVGYLPRHLAQAAIAAGRLVAREVAESKPDIQLVLAWRTQHVGGALRWFLRELQDPGVISGLLE